MKFIIPKRRGNFLFIVSEDCRAFSEDVRHFLIARRSCDCHTKVSDPFPKITIDCRKVLKISICLLVQISKTMLLLSRLKVFKPGSWAFFKEYFLFATFLASMMELKQNLTRGEILPSLNFFFNDNGISYGHVTCHLTLPEKNCKYLRNCQRI